MIAVDAFVVGKGVCAGRVSCRAASPSARAAVSSSLSEGKGVKNGFVKRKEMSRSIFEGAGIRGQMVGERQKVPTARPWHSLSAMTSSQTNPETTPASPPLLGSPCLSAGVFPPLPPFLQPPNRFPFLHAPNTQCVRVCVCVWL